MRRLRHLASQHRTASTHRLLGGMLAFNAGAVNAGGFLGPGLYTSHMTGSASTLGDQFVPGSLKLVLAAVGALLAFTVGAAVTAVLALAAVLLLMSLPPLWHDLRRLRRRAAPTA